MLSTDKKHFIFLIAILLAENSLIDVIDSCLRQDRILCSLSAQSVYHVDHLVKCLINKLLRTI